MSTPLILNQINHDAISLGLLNKQAPEIQGQYFWKQVQASNISYILFGDQSGQFLAAGHFYGDHRITIDEVNHHRHGNYHLYIHGTDELGNRTQDIRDMGNMYVEGKFSLHSEGWYTAAVDKGGPTWTPVYNWAVAPFPLTIATSRPIYDPQNNLIGIIAVEQQLSQMNDFFKRINVSPSGKTYIIERNGLLIASSSDEHPFIVEGDKPKRIKASASNDPLIKASASYLAKQFDHFKMIEGNQQMSFQFEGKRHFIQVLPWQDDLGLDWLIVVAVPESDFMTQINANTRTTIYLCLGALGVAIVLGFYTSRWIAQPILRLSHASQAIASGDLEQKVYLKGIKELSILSRSKRPRNVAKERVVSS